MTTLTNGTSPQVNGANVNGTKKQLLRDLNNEYRDTQVALNQAQASLSRAMKLAEQNYQRKRQQIINAPYYES